VDKGGLVWDTTDDSLSSPTTNGKSRVVRLCTKKKKMFKNQKTNDKEKRGRGFTKSVRLPKGRWKGAGDRKERRNAFQRLNRGSKEGCDPKRNDKRT